MKRLRGVFSPRRPKKETIILSPHDTPVPGSNGKRRSFKFLSKSSASSPPEEESSSSPSAPTGIAASTTTTTTTTATKRRQERSPHSSSSSSQSRPPSRPPLTTAEEEEAELFRDTTIPPIPRKGGGGPPPTTRTKTKTGKKPGRKKQPGSGGARSTKPRSSVGSSGGGGSSTRTSTSSVNGRGGGGEGNSYITDSPNSSIHGTDDTPRPSPGGSSTPTKKKKKKRPTPSSSSTSSNNHTDFPPKLPLDMDDDDENDINQVGNGQMIHRKSKNMKVMEPPKTKKKKKTKTKTKNQNSSQLATTTEEEDGENDTGDPPRRQQQQVGSLPSSSNTTKKKRQESVPKKKGVKNNNKSPGKVTSTTTTSTSAASDEAIMNPPEQHQQQGKTKKKKNKIANDNNSDSTTPATTSTMRKYAPPAPLQGSDDGDDEGEERLSAPPSSSNSLVEGMATGGGGEDDEWDENNDNDEVGRDYIGTKLLSPSSSNSLLRSSGHDVAPPVSTSSLLNEEDDDDDDEADEENDSRPLPRKKGSLTSNEKEDEWVPLNPTKPASTNTLGVDSLAFSIDSSVVTLGTFASNTSASLAYSYRDDDDDVDDADDDEEEEDEDDDSDDSEEENDGEEMDIVQKVRDISQQKGRGPGHDEFDNSNGEISFPGEDSESEEGDYYYDDEDDDDSEEEDYESDTSSIYFGSTVLDTVLEAENEEDETPSSEDLHDSSLGGDNGIIMPKKRLSGEVSLDILMKVASTSTSSLDVVPTGTMEEKVPTGVVVMSSEAAPIGEESKQEQDIEYDTSAKESSPIVSDDDDDLTSRPQLSPSPSTFVGGLSVVSISASSTNELSLDPEGGASLMDTAGVDNSEMIVCHRGGGNEVIDQHTHVSNREGTVSTTPFITKKNESEPTPASSRLEEGKEEEKESTTTEMNQHTHVSNSEGPVPTTPVITKKIESELPRASRLEEGKEEQKQPTTIGTAHEDRKGHGNHEDEKTAGPSHPNQMLPLLPAEKMVTAENDQDQSDTHLDPSKGGEESTAKVNVDSPLPVAVSGGESHSTSTTENEEEDEEEEEGVGSDEGIPNSLPLQATKSFTSTKSDPPGKSSEVGVDGQKEGEENDPKPSQEEEKPLIENVVSTAQLEQNTATPRRGGNGQDDDAYNDATTDAEQVGLHELHGGMLETGQETNNIGVSGKTSENQASKGDYQQGHGKNGNGANHPLHEVESRRPQDDASECSPLSNDHHTSSVGGNSLERLVEAKRVAAVKLQSGFQNLLHNNDVSLQDFAVAADLRLQQEIGAGRAKDFDRIQEENMKLQQQLSESLRKVVQLTEEQLELKREAWKTAKALAQAEEDFLASAADIEELEKKNRRSARNTERQASTIANLEKELANQMLHREALEVKLKSTDVHVSKMEEEMKGMQREIKILRGVDELGGFGLQPRDAEIIKTAVIGEDEKSKEEALVQKAGKEVDLMRKINALEIENATVIEKHHIEMAEQSARIVSLEQQLEIQSTQHEATLEALKCANLELEGMSMEMEETFEQNEALKESVSEFESTKAQLNDARMELDRREKAIEILTKSLDEKEGTKDASSGLREQSHVLEEENAALVRKLEQMELEIVEKSKKIAAFEEQVKVQGVLQESLVDKLKSSNREVEELKRDIDEINDESEFFKEAAKDRLDGIRNQLDESENTIDDLKKTIDKRELELQARGRKEIGLQEQLHTLEEEYRALKERFHMEQLQSAAQLLEKNKDMMIMQEEVLTGYEKDPEFIALRQELERCQTDIAAARLALGEASQKIGTLWEENAVLQRTNCMLELELTNGDLRTDDEADDLSVEDEVSE